MLVPAQRDEALAKLVDAGLVPENAVVWLDDLNDHMAVGWTAPPCSGCSLAQRGEEVEAERWYRAGAEAGDGTAMANLGALMAQRGESAAPPDQRSQ